MQKTKNTQEKKSVSFDYTIFNTRQEKWDVMKFIKLNPYIMNRDIEPRIPKMIARLSEGPKPTHIRVAVGVVKKPFAKYKTGDYFRFDGNTRSESWKVKPELMPNVPLIVDVYEVRSKDDADKIYYDIDSSESVEKSAEKITGQLREKEYVAVSKIIKKGNFKTAVNNACRYVKDVNGKSLSNKEYQKRFDIKLDTFWDEIATIDNMNLDMFSKNRYSGNVLTALLMVTKKYGIKNDRLRLLFENYAESISTINNGTSMDGVHFVSNVVFAEYSTMWTATGFSNARIVISKILYGFDKFMRNETIPKKLKNKKFLEFYENYFK